MVTLEHVKKSFGDRQVLADASIRVNKGERVCLFGPSGCGKTTLLRILCGLDKPDSGTVQVTAERIACHFQEDRLLPWYTVADNLRLTVGADWADWLRRVQLPDAANLYPDELSGGMRRRVSLARALGFRSDLLVLDEPLRELDAKTSDAMLRLIDESVGERALILVTHDMHQAEALGCRIIHLPM